MSKHINVNPGQYKVAGRERPGQDIPEPERSKDQQSDQEARERWEKKQEQKKG
jgi:hypothetical protein